jgi:hypothetical protein
MLSCAPKTKGVGKSAAGVSSSSGGGGGGAWGLTASRCIRECNRKAKAGFLFFSWFSSAAQRMPLSQRPD